MSLRAIPGEFCTVLLHLVDPPELAMRETFDEPKLMELADSIKAHGLISPLLLRRRGHRFEIVAGHRRYTALKMIDALSAPAIVVDGDDIDFEALKVAENSDREDVNPAQEAKYLATLLQTRCGDDTDALARMVGRSRGYVETRLLMLKGDPRIFEALANDKIGIGVARELNGIKDPNIRLVCLESAVKGGCTQQRAQQWRIEYNGFTDRQVDSAAAAGDATTQPTQPADSVNRCICCNGDDDFHLMRLVYVHDGCYRSVLRPLLGGGAPASA